MFKLLKEKIISLIKRKKEKIEEETKKEEKIEEETKEEKLEKVESKKRLFKFGIIKIDEKRIDDFLEDLRLILWQNNVANEVVEYIEKRLKEVCIGKEIDKKEFENFIKENLKKIIDEILLEPYDIIEKIKEKKEKPFVIVFFGINGSGKTTTIAKIAYLLKKHNLSCVFAASDTFRAASIEQIEKHAKNLNIKVIKHKYGSDPAAVAFDAINHAKANNIDVVLIDTSGRMHTDRNLIEEMKKICRVSKPDIKIFVGEAIVGNDAIEQGKTFNEEIGIDGIILTKADVDEKGGAALSIGYITKKPILFLGIGQNYDDLEFFNKEKILKNIF
ncbi:MAG: signal recognition particle-docking protein FtsY [Candidatus Pacearchaeota archaeon]